MFPKLFDVKIFCYILCLLVLCDATTNCYAGQNSVFASRQCGNKSFGDDDTFVCQTYTCYGGKLPFTFRDCANDTNCDAAAKLCAQYNGNGICFTCADNLCNGIGDLLVAEWEAERQKAIPLSIYAFLIGFGAFLLVVGSVSFFIFVSRFNIRLFRFCSC
ncbi:hypothetical protein niasHS_001923 [Heterodera schachtii]|uniref:Transmembrane protein n=1 Tax=Heterodera schachtii TaxID=97005 RepID=A0ABD2KAP2_HETSC